MTLKKEIEEILHPEKKPTGETDSDRLSESGESPVNTIVRDRAESSKPVGLKPPPIPQLKVEKVSIKLDSMPKSYWDYCDSSEAKRAWNKARFGKVHRGSTEDLKRHVIQRDMELDMITLMKKEKAPLYWECVKELKEVLKERRDKLK